MILIKKRWLKVKKKRELSLGDDFFYPQITQIFADYKNKPSKVSHRHTLTHKQLKKISHESVFALLGSAAAGFT